MTALDAGAIATYAGFSFGWTAAAGGIAGLASTAALPWLLTRFADDQRLQQSPVMEAGRVLAIAAIGLAIANTTPLAAPVAIASAAIAAALLQRREATGFALLAGLSPVIQWVGSFAQPESLLDWLAAMTTATPVTTVAVALIAIVSIAALHRGPYWAAVAAVIGAIAVPSAVDIFGQHHDGSLIAAAAVVVGFRIVAKMVGRPEWLPLIDVAALLISAIAFLTGSVRFLDTHLLSNESTHPLDLGIVVTAMLLALGWLLSDLLSEGGTVTGRIWSGASGPIATIGLASATLVGAVGSMQFDRAGIVIAVAALGLGVTQRKGSLPLLRIGLPLASVLLLGEPVVALAIVIGGALTSQFRAHRDLGEGAAPARASMTQLAGIASLAIGSLATAGVWRNDPGSAVLAALAVGSALVVMGIASSRLAVPDLQLAPRLALPMVLLPVWSDLGLAGGVALALAVVFLADSLALRTPASQWLAPIHVTAGMWLIANQPWWQASPITSSDWWFFGPSLIVGVFGWNELRNGNSSWHGFGPAFAIVGVTALLDRVAGGGGWHGVVAGFIGLVALVIGVERRWSSPTVIGAGLLFAAISIEVGGVVPRIPVWALLSTGGAILLGFGWMLERNAGAGPMASLRSTWSEFR